MTLATSKHGIAFERRGSGPPVLMIHPAFTDRRAFAVEAEALAERYDVIRIDLPGHGQTQATPPRPIMLGIADALGELLEAEGIDSVDLVGCSLGALVAQDFARRQPARARSLFAIGAYEVTDKTAVEAQNHETRSMLWNVLFRPKKFREHIITSATHTPEGQALIRPLVEGFARSGLRSMQGTETIIDPERTDGLSCRTKIVIGEHDLPVVRESAARWVERLGNRGTLEIIGGAGHCANLDRPDEVRGLLEDWLAA